jgi:hypothetical protein
MPIQKDDHQDDYYAHVAKSSTRDDGSKKPLKLKLKAVIKKPDESSESIPEAPMSSEVETPKQ